MTFFEILRPADRVDAFAETGPLSLARQGDRWQAGDVAVHVWLQEGCLAVELTAADTPVARVRVRWRMPVPDGMRFLGDHWERGYGDLEWRGLVPQRVMPWTFLAHDGTQTHGYGVRAPAAAFCFWTVDGEGVSLWLDVRNGGTGIRLQGRVLRAAEVVARRGQEGETPFQAACALYRALCPTPRLPDVPVYGSNNWYYAYGKSSHQAILEDTRLLVSLAPGGDNRPYMVIDAGWQAGVNEGIDACGGSAWDRGNRLFPDMPGLASAMRDVGARPGIWVRPLVANQDDSEALLLPAARTLGQDERRGYLDPSLPEVLERVTADVRRLRAWGYDLIKHDFTTYDILGRWGFQMGPTLTNDGWHMADRSRTTAEIVRDLYLAIRRGAGDALLIGCNTVGHLGAGLFELQRTGDDTSGREWERTRKMGINTLAFRMPQHNAFFASDADCVGLTDQVPWELNRRWLDLLARSGTPLFVSADPAAVGPEQARALREAFAAASRPQPVGEPLDWMDTTCPRSWRLGGQRVTFDWYGDAGVDPL